MTVVPYTGALSIGWGAEQQSPPHIKI